MFKRVCFSVVLLILSNAWIQAAEINVAAAFAVLSDRLDRLALDKHELKAIVEKTLATYDAQINDIATELSDISERINGFFDDFRGNGHMTEDGSVREFVSSLVRQDFSREKEVLREFVGRYERELESLGRYVSDNIVLYNDTEPQDGSSNLIPEISSSSNTCKMCMLVASTAEKKTRRLEQMLSDLTKETLERNEVYESLQTEVEETMDKVAALQEDERNHEENLNGITEDIDALRTYIDSLNEKQERKVGFTARLTQRRHSFLGNTILEFDEVMYNYGEGYDNHTGIFTAPKAGTYLISFNVQSTEMMDAHVCLIVNGTLRLTAVAGRGHRVTGGNTGIVYMEEGEEAWVRTTTLKPKFGIWPYRTTFSGVLLD